MYSFRGWCVLAPSISKFTNNSVKLESNVFIFRFKNSEFDRSSSAEYISRLRLWSSVNFIMNVNKFAVHNYVLGGSL